MVLCLSYAQFRSVFPHLISEQFNKHAFFICKTNVINILCMEKGMLLCNHEIVQKILLFLRLFILLEQR